MTKINGSMIEPENHARLEHARQILAQFKELKLHLRHEKQLQRQQEHGSATTDTMYAHLVSEFQELEQSFITGNSFNQIEEIADIINCAEILATTIIT